MTRTPDSTRAARPPRATRPPREPRMPRVLMTADTLGGVWMYAIELSRNLRRHGVQVVLATMGRALTVAQRREAHAVPDLVLCESTFRLEWMDAPWPDVDRAGHWLLQLTRRYRPDLVHLNQFSHGHLDWGVPSVIVGHSCVLSWWQAVYADAAPAQWDQYRTRVRRGLQTADQVVAPSTAMLQSLETHYGPLPATAVVYNGRAAAAYPPRRKQRFVLAAGRVWDAAKNLQALTRIAPELQVPVYLAGESRHPDGGELMLPGVRRLGELPPDAMAQWYGHAAIYALPARYEPFGLSVLEAALAGCAPVIGDIPSLRELWADAACLVPPDDEQALQTVINRLAHDHVWRERLAATARRRALCYSAARMAGGYLDIYRTLLPGRFRIEPQRVASG